MRWLRWTAWLLLAGVPAAAQQVSLGELARRQRATKAPETRRVFTNDDLAAGDFKQAKKAEPQTARLTESEKPAASPVEAFQEKERAFKARYTEQQREVEKAERRLTVARNEYDNQTTLYWMDAGSRLRDNDRWAEKRAGYEKEIDGARQQVTAAREKLDAIKEEARRAGVAESWLER